MKKVVRYLSFEQKNEIAQELREIVYDYHSVHEAPNFKNSDFLLSCIALTLGLPIGKKYLENQYQEALLSGNSVYDIDPALLDQLLILISKDSDGVIREVSAANPDSPSDLLTRLLQDPEDFVREVVAANPRIPTDVLLMRAKDADPSVIRGIAKNPGTPVEMLDVLAKSEDEWIRFYVALNPATPQDIVDELLPELAQDESELKRLRVAENPRVPTNILKKLSEDSALFDLSSPGTGVPSIQFAVFSNPNTPQVLKDELAHKFFKQVKTGRFETETTNESKLTEIEDEYLFTLASNPNTPRDILSELVVMTKRQNWKIRDALQSNPNLPIELLIDVIRKGTAVYEKDEVLFFEHRNHEKFSRHSASVSPNSEKESELAKAREQILDSLWAISHPKFPTDFLTELAGHPEVDVRKAVVANINTPLSALSQLALDDEVDIRMSVAANAQTPTEDLEILAQDPEWKVRLNVADNENTPSEVLMNLSSDDEGMIRCLVGWHHNTPNSILEKLAQDPDELVQFAVKQNNNFNH